jgi:acetyl-CoA carboxylase carboxyltransferase component
VTVLDTALDPRAPGYLERRSATLERLAQLEIALEIARAGGGEKAVTRHHARGKLLPRERVEMLLDQDSPFLELSPVAAWGTEVPAGAGVVTGIGVVQGVECVLIANDPTVDGGAVNTYALAKIRRAARISAVNRLPLITLVESAAEDASEATPGGGIARDLSRLAVRRVPTVCVVFGATSGDVACLPALSDYTVMVRGHAGIVCPPPAGTDQPGTGGPAPGPADLLAEDERDALRLARQCVRRLNWRKRGPAPRTVPPGGPQYPPDDLLTMAAVDQATLFDPREVLARVLDDSDFDEFKPAYGTALVTGWGELHGYPVAVLANVGAEFTPAETQKAVHFIQLANAADTSLLFLRHPGPAGPEEHAAPLVHAMAKSTVPHLVLLIGGAARPDAADEPRFVFRWPVEGDKTTDRPEDVGDDDGFIDPRDTRTVLGLCLSAVHSATVEGAGHVGVFRPGKVDQ